MRMEMLGEHRRFERDEARRHGGRAGEFPKPNQDPPQREEETETLFGRAEAAQQGKAPERKFEALKHGRGRSQIAR